MKFLQSLLQSLAAVAAKTKPANQTVVDQAVNVAAMALLGVTNDAIDAANAIPNELKPIVKLVVAGPILALKIKL